MAFVKCIKVKRDHENICTGCHAQVVNTKFHPCNHQMLCLSCSCQTRVCPKCARQIYRIDYRNHHDGTGVVMMHRTLLLHQQGVRNRDLLHYPQILFLGDSLSDKKVILSTVFQECALGNGDEYIKEQLPIQRRFRPNAIIDGQLFRISLLEGVDWIDGEQMLNCVQTLRPDVVIVCLSVSKKNKLIEFKNWSRNLSYLRGIDICWLLAPDKVNGVAELVDRAQFEKSLIQSVAASDMLTEHYFSMVGGMAAVTPRQLVRQLITNARAVRNDVTHRSLASEVSSLFDDALSEF